MSKKPRKRTKRYQGEDAKQTTVSSEPVVHRFEAVERSKVGEWWQPRKKLFRFGALAVAIGGGSIFLISELIRIVF